MAKVKGIKKKEVAVVNENDMTMNREMFQEIVMNTITSRSALLGNLFETRRDIEQECGYPTCLTKLQYKNMYDREALATRVVNLLPQESWCVDPEVVEDEKPDDTEFEGTWKELERDHQLYSYMLRIDELSGVGRYGILLFGINDGKELSETVEGIDDQGNKTGNQTYELLYLKPFEEYNVCVKATEQDKKNKRYGNSAIEPLGVFTSHVKGEDSALDNMLVRLDDKLKRIKNADELRKNDVADIIGYLILLCINQGWEDFSDLID